MSEFSAMDMGGPDAAERARRAHRAVIQELLAGGFGKELHPVPRTKKFPVFDGWPEWKPSEEDQLGWLQGLPDLGLKTRGFPTLDVDLSKLEHIKAVGEVVREFVTRRGGEFLARTRTGAPRYAVIFRLPERAEPFRKIVQKFDVGGGVTESVELLAHGQQLKIVGGHPDGDTYGLAGTIDADKLPELDEAGAYELVERIRQALAGLGLKPQGTPSGGGQARQRSAVDAAAGKDAALEAHVRGVMASFPPNDHAVFPDYDRDFIPTLGALYGASGGAEWGLELAKDWALSGDYAGENSPEDIEKRWRSFGQGVALGLDNLESICAEKLGVWVKDGGGSRREADARRARLGSLQIGRLEARFGKASVALDRQGLPPLGNSARSPAPGIAGWARPYDLPPRISSVQELQERLVWVADEAAYVDRRTGASFDTRAAVDHTFQANIAGDPALEVHGQTPAGKPTIRYLTAWEWLQRERIVQRVDSRDYRQGEPEFIRTSNRVVLNMWRPAQMRARLEDLVLAGRAPTVADNEVQWFLDLVGYILRGSAGPGVGVDVPVERFLDWVAWVVCTDEKPAHHYVINSDVQGVGKSTLANAIAALIQGGERGTLARTLVAELDHNIISSQFNGWAKARLGIAHELRDAVGQASTRGEQKDQYRAMKPVLAAPPFELPINEKFKQPYVARNVLAFLGLTNEGADVLVIERDERRLVFLNSVAGRMDRATAEPAHRALGAADAWAEGVGGLWKLLAWCRARWAAVLATCGVPGDRYDVLTGPAWRTSYKEQVEDAGKGALATEMERAMRDGRLGWLATLDDMRRALAHGAGSYSGRTLTDGQLGAAVRALGGGRVRETQIRLPGAEDRRVRLWCLDRARLEDVRGRKPEQIAGWYGAAGGGGETFGVIENEKSQKKV